MTHTFALSLLCFALFRRQFCAFLETCFPTKSCIYCKIVQCNTWWWWWWWWWWQNVDCSPDPGCRAALGYMCITATKVGAFRQPAGTSNLAADRSALVHHTVRGKEKQEGGGGTRRQEGQIGGRHCTSSTINLYSWGARLNLQKCFLLLLGRG